MVEADFDARASGTDPPAASEKERGCLRRAFDRLAGRVAPLCALLGQMIRAIKPSVGECWKALRELDNLEGILLLLGEKFNTSLLADYRCLRPTLWAGKQGLRAQGWVVEFDPTQRCIFNKATTGGRLPGGMNQQENRKNEVALRRFAAVSFIEQKQREGFGTWSKPSA
jgi:hypothetical protein